MKKIIIIITALIAYSCSNKDNSSNKDRTKLIVVIDSPLDYLEKSENQYFISKELIDFILPFKNEELDNKIIPSVVINQIGKPEDLELFEESNMLGIKPKIDKLREKMANSYAKFEVPKEFYNYNRNKEFEFEDLEKIISPNQSQDSVIILCFKGNSFDGIKKTNYLTFNIKDTKDYQLNIINLTEKYPTFKIYFLYKVNFKLQEKPDVAIIVEPKSRNSEVKKLKKVKMREVSDNYQAQNRLEEEITRYKKIKKILTGDRAKKYEQKIAKVLAELEEVKETLKVLEEEINDINSQLGLAKVDLQKEREKNQSLISKLDSSNLAGIKNNTENEKLKIQIVVNEVNNLIEKGLKETELVELDANGEVVVLKIDKFGDKVPVIGIPPFGVSKKTYNEHRNDVKKAICNYFYQARNKANSSGVSTKQIQKETEKLMNIYYKLCKKSDIEDIYFDNYNSFLDACK